MQISIIAAIIKAFRIVPIPGFCRRGIQNSKTVILIIRVITPIDKLTFKEIPWARTLQGEAPELETINNPSPNPKNVKPKHKKNIEENLGLILKGFFELQETFGIFFIDKNIFFTIIYTFLN